MTEATIAPEGEQVLTPTSVDDIKRISRGDVIELPPFLDGTPFHARLRRPSTLQLAKHGIIPNSLNNAIEDLMGMSNESKATLAERAEVLEIIAREALVEPSYDDVSTVLENGQYMAIFAYVQMGVHMMEPFRTFSQLLVSGPGSGEVERAPELVAGDNGQPDGVLPGRGGDAPLEPDGSGPQAGVPGAEGP